MPVKSTTKNYAHTHRMSKTPEYQSWASMKQRCLNPRSKPYAYYGGRGISICPEWVNSFEVFYRDMGPRPTPKHTLDRIENDDNYKPSNCKWSTRKEQVENRRDWAFFTYNGETRSVTEWAKHLGVGYQVLYHRLLRHPSDDILSMRLQPVRTRGEANNMAKLTEVKVRELRRLYDSGITTNYHDLGDRFSINWGTARCAALRLTWKHVL